MQHTGEKNHTTQRDGCPESAGRAENSVPGGSDKWRPRTPARESGARVGRSRSDASRMDAGPLELIRPGNKNGPPNPFRL